MTDNDLWQSPVVIGGVNGSGTRVVAQILRELDYYIGQDFNAANDNLWFTMLFRRPPLYPQNEEAEAPEVKRAINIFTRIMLNGASLTREDWRYILNVAIRFSFEQRRHLSVWVYRRLRSIVRRELVDIAQYYGWGWKEPHTHLYLPQLANYFPDMRYILVIRHGLDMAYSGNQAQLYQWGPLLGVTPPSDREDEPLASLRFWIRANQRATDLGNALLGNRFMILNFDQLCINPHAEIEKMTQFLGIVNPDIDSLAKLPKLPSSKDRYRMHDNTIFSTEEIRAVESFGFEVDL